MILASPLLRKGFENLPVASAIHSAGPVFPEIQGHTLLNHASFHPEEARLRMCNGQGMVQPCVSLASVCCATNLIVKSSLAGLLPTSEKASGG